MPKFGKDMRQTGKFMDLEPGFDIYLGSDTLLVIALQEEKRRVWVRAHREKAFHQRELPWKAP